MEHYIHPFIKGCEEVFRDLCKTEISPGRPFFVNKDEFERNWDISGIIGLSGEADGAVVMSFKEETAFKITSILTGKEHTTVDNLVADAVGEVVNIVTGNVKDVFEVNYRIHITMPSIIKGKEHAIVWPSKKARIICIPFGIFENQEFFLSIAVDNIK